MARKTKVKKNQTVATTELLASLDIQPVNTSELVLLPKDDEEEELEKLVFGDLDGFKAGLRAHEQSDSEDDKPDKDAGVHGDHNAVKGREIGALQDDEVGATFPAPRWALANRVASCFS